MNKTASMLHCNQSTRDSVVPGHKPTTNLTPFHPLPHPAYPLPRPSPSNHPPALIAHPPPRHHARPTHPPSLSTTFSVQPPTAHQSLFPIDYLYFGTLLAKLSNFAPGCQWDEPSESACVWVPALPAAAPRGPRAPRVTS